MSLLLETIVMNKIYYTFLISLVLTTSCATPYQTTGFTGGFTDTQLSETIWKVSAAGNAFTSKTAINDYALLRASELTLQNGYKYFVVINEDQTSTSHKADFGQTSNTYGNISSTGSFNARTTTNNNVTNYTKHYNDLVFEMLADKKDGIFAYNAEMIYSSLSAQYIK